MATSRANEPQWVKLHMTDICPQSEVVGMLLEETKEGNRGDFVLGAMVVNQQGAEEFIEGVQLIMRQHVWWVEKLDGQPVLNQEERPELYGGMGGLG